MQINIDSGSDTSVSLDKTVLLHNAHDFHSIVVLPTAVQNFRVIFSASVMCSFVHCLWLFAKHELLFQQSSAIIYSFHQIRIDDEGIWLLLYWHVKFLFECCDIQFSWLSQQDTVAARYCFSGGAHLQCKNCGEAFEKLSHCY